MADETAVDTRTPDAIRMPRAGMTVEARADQDAMCAALLGVPQVWARDQGSTYFVTGNPADSLHWPNTSAHPGQPCYQWEDQGEGISFGYRIPEAELPKPSVGNVLTRLREIQAQREAARRAGGAPAPGGAISA